jgi:hypothetical protein
VDGIAPAIAAEVDPAGQFEVPHQDEIGETVGIDVHQSEFIGAHAGCLDAGSGSARRPVTAVGVGPVIDPGFVADAREGEPIFEAVAVEIRQPGDADGSVLAVEPGFVWRPILGKSRVGGEDEFALPAGREVEDVFDTAGAAAEVEGAHDIGAFVEVQVQHAQGRMRNIQRAELTGLEVAAELDFRAPADDLGGVEGRGFAKAVEVAMGEDAGAGGGFLEQVGETVAVEVGEGDAGFGEAFADGLVGAVLRIGGEGNLVGEGAVARVEIGVPAGAVRAHEIGKAVGIDVDHLGERGAETEEVLSAGDGEEWGGERGGEA